MPVASVCYTDPLPEVKADFGFCVGGASGCERGRCWLGPFLRTAFLSTVFLLNNLLPRDAARGMLTMAAFFVEEQSDGI
jgi:hypothetical protein